MYAYAVVLLSVVVGSAYGEAPYNYNPQRQVPYNVGPNDPYPARANYISEPSQRLFWSQGSNSVGGPGLWTTLTNKFPFLQSMFGRMELPAEYGAPVPNSQYGVPTQQYYANTNYQTPQFFQPQSYLQPQSYQQPQIYQRPQFYSQQLPVFRQQFPSGRDVGFTDDAVIVTPPQVPIAPQPAPFPPQPAPIPQPAPVPGDGGYQYNKPQYRLELPHK